MKPSCPHGGGGSVNSSHCMHTLTPLCDPLPPQEHQLAVTDCLEGPDPHPTPPKPYNLTPLPQEHQLAVIDCLEDPDDTLKLKTLELLYKMTKANNVEVGGEEGSLGRSGAPGGGSGGHQGGGISS